MSYLKETWVYIYGNNHHLVIATDHPTTNDIPVSSDSFFSKTVAAVTLAYLTCWFCDAKKSIVTEYLKNFMSWKTLLSLPIIYIWVYIFFYNLKTQRRYV